MNKPEPLKDKDIILTDVYIKQIGEREEIIRNKPIRAIPEYKHKLAVEWLKIYLRCRKKGCDSIKIKSLLIVIDIAFGNVTKG